MSLSGVHLFSFLHDVAEHKLLLVLLQELH
jgi:hypothetical protein